jgi:hypothetical protein
VGYEGGTGSVDRSRDLAPQFAAHRDPRMAENLTHHVRDNWFAAGGDLLCLFTLNAVSGPYGAWGLLEGDISRLDAPKYRAASELAAMALPPVTVGCALPARVSGQALLPVSPNGEARLSSGETLGPFLLRSERAGQYRGTLDGSQEGPDVRVEVWVDNRRAGVVSLPVSPSAGASGPVTVDLPAGLHGLVLRAAGTGGRALFTPESRITITRMM